MDERGDAATVCADIACAVTGHEDLETAVAGFFRLPLDFPARPRLAVVLVEALMRTDPMSHPERLIRLDSLLEIAEADPSPGPRWTLVRASARIAALLRAVLAAELSDLDEATRRLDAIFRDGGDDPTLASLVEGARLSLRMYRSVREGDAGALGRLPDEVSRMLGSIPQHQDPRLGSLAGLLSSASGVLSANAAGAGDLEQRMQAFHQAAEGLPAGDLRDLVDELLPGASLLAAQLGNGGGPRLSDAQLDGLYAQARQPGLPPADQAQRMATAAAAALWGGEEKDLSRVDPAVDHLRQALDLIGPDDPQRVLQLNGLALGLYRRSELTNATADLREARTVLLEARDLAGGPQNAAWQPTNELLSIVNRLLGDAPDFHRPTLEGMRSHLWRALAQPDLAGVTAAVRTAATDAVDGAVACLVANDPVAAINVLEAGRGLALFAATEVRNVADRLSAAGDSDLAQRWRAAVATRDPERLTPDLRRAAWAVLIAGSSAATLLDPPTVEEIQQALSVTDADALVYLVPASGARTGFAVVAPVEGPPSIVALPGLTVEDDPELKRYLTALIRQDGAAAGDSDPGTRGFLLTAAEPELNASLEGLGRWAWRAAIRPLVDDYLPRLPRPASGRPPHLVLVPTGDLARVPWPAARTPDNRYAVQLVGISQAASARMLCHSAALPLVPVTAAGLVLGDPDTAGRGADLAGARLEAYAVRQTFYPTARYLGRRPNGSESPSGPGTREQLDAWLGAAGPAAGAMLHLACHGVVRTDGDEPTAHLLLAGRDTLTAQELIALLDRAPERNLGLVVLAGCRTGQSITGYDEAYSLGTTFLAGGARSVVSTLWSIPDDASSALMFMFHRQLRVEGLPPWAALRAAQLWMLDPDREVPADMPKQLRAKLDSVDLESPLGWAAFVHWGQ